MRLDKLQKLCTPHMGSPHIRRNKHWGPVRAKQFRSKLLLLIRLVEFQRRGPHHIGSHHIFRKTVATMRLVEFQKWGPHHIRTNKKNKKDKCIFCWGRLSSRCEALPTPGATILLETCCLFWLCWWKQSGAKIYLEIHCFCCWMSSRSEAHPTSDATIFSNTLLFW